jgi:hypothetical protein
MTMNKEVRRSQSTTRREMLAAPLIGVAAGGA